MKRLGPEIKLSELKTPRFVSDLFYDLRERRLLPLVALLIVAIVAVPFLLSDPGSGTEDKAPATAAAASEGEAESFTVVQADHGLREPHRRLAHRKPKDPFKQQFVGPENAGQIVTQTSATETTTVTETSSASGESTRTEISPESTESAGTQAQPNSPSQNGGSGAGSKGANEGQHLQIFTFAIDVKVVPIAASQGGTADQAEPEIRKGVLPTTSLPGKKKQVVTYLGISPKTEKPLFLVSDEVTSVFGEGKCAAGSGACQLIELEPGFPETFVYGENSERYKINVLKVEPVRAGES